ncbi:hypothetical protein N7524_001102 [Penicillium chrysogenum]|nr:hypothetical protein N7524_001102 [Penicillium chrysogenum]
MANSLYSDDAYQLRTGDPWDENSQYAPTPGYFGRTPTMFSPSPAPDCPTDQAQSDQLDFLPLVEWDKDANMTSSLQDICSVTEKDLVVAPSDYWVNILKPAVEEMLQMKKKSGQQVRVFALA